MGRSVAAAFAARFETNSENIDIKVFEIEKRACRRRPRLAADHRLRRR
jgi:hypothetical protein